MNWLEKLFKKQVFGKGHWEQGADGQPHYIPGPSYWVWRWVD